MIPTVRFGRTGLAVTRLALGGYPFGGVNLARGWDPFSSEGRAQAITTIHAALDAGITLVDTAPGYGDGNSESIFGEALRGRRDEVVLASKVGYHGDARSVRESVETSLRRLQTGVIDVIQFHGGMYTDEEVRHMMDDGLLAMLETLRDEGKVRFLGFTVEEPWTARPLIASGAFDVMQVRYNIIYQAAALHVLNQARARDMGISVMRPMTSGIMQRMASYIAPGWCETSDLYEVCLKFVLSDSRVHVANVGMRWPEEVEKNVAVASGFAPPFDMADLPRMTAHIYQTEDEMEGIARDGK
jgi:aryl-alcohol dehydrogenase-like predicted oxidoreductase